MQWTVSIGLRRGARRIVLRIVGLLKGVVDALEVDQGFAIGGVLGHIGKSLVPAHVFVVVGMACIDALRNGFVRAI